MSQNLYCATLEIYGKDECSFVRLCYVYFWVGVGVFGLSALFLLWCVDDDMVGMWFVVSRSRWRGAGWRNKQG